MPPLSPLLPPPVSRYGTGEKEPSSLQGQAEQEQQQQQQGEQQAEQLESEAKPGLQRSLSRQAISRLHSIRRDRNRSPPAWDTARPDSATLNDQPRIMTPARAYTIARTNLSIRSQNRGICPVQFPALRSPLSPSTSSQLSPKSPPLQSPPPSKKSPSLSCSTYSISAPIGEPYYPTAEQYGGYGTVFSRMRSDTHSSNPDWLSSVRSALRLLIIIASGAVIGLLTHTIIIYRSNRFIKLRDGEVPVPWPAKTNMISTYTLLTVAVTGFLVSVTSLVLSFLKMFRRRSPSRNATRIMVASGGVVGWTAALLVYSIVNNETNASLGNYACRNRNRMANGRYQHRLVCDEQVYTSRVHIALRCLLKL